MITPETLIPLGLTFDDVLLVPRRTRARSRKDVDVSTQLTKQMSIKIPVISANTPWCTEATMAIVMAKLGGIGIIHRMTTAEIQAALVEKVKNTVIDRSIFPLASVDANNLPLVGAAIGTKDDYLERAQQLVDYGVNILVVDIAHGHADYALDAISKLKSLYPHVDIIGGNVATAEAVSDLIDAGADAIKVGIGPGAVCTTRLVAGAGVPQLTAIIECATEARKQGIPIIADGGIRTSGDIAKAIAAGASTVMLGSMLAGTDESAAQLVERDGHLYKISTGFPSLGVELTLKQIRNEEITEDEVKEYVPEGVDATFEYKGSVADVLNQLIGGLRSGMSYSGSLSISEFWEQARFIQVTAAGQAENKPHIQTQNIQVHPDYRNLVAQKKTAQNSVN
jgi:IMP dehydrogenase/GMP reductase